MDQSARAGVVVCGVDGSAGARLALVEAIRTAARWGDRVLALTVYEPIESLGAWGYGAAADIPLPAPGELHDAAERAAATTLNEVMASLDDEVSPMPEASVEARPGHPATILAESARDADALVVGHRGRGAVHSALMGSVSLGCVLHARCPVTVVPEPRGATGTDET